MRKLFPITNPFYYTTVLFAAISFILFVLLEDQIRRSDVRAELIRDVAINSAICIDGNYGCKIRSTFKNCKIVKSDIFYYSPGLSAKIEFEVDCTANMLLPKHIGSFEMTKISTNLVSNRQIVTYTIKNISNDYEKYLIN